VLPSAGAGSACWRWSAGFADGDRALPLLRHVSCRAGGAVSGARRTIQRFGLLVRDLDEALRAAGRAFNAVKDEFKRQGLPFSMPHIGHGMGIGLHEFPMLEPGNDIKLQAGMVLNIEPMAVVESRQEAYHTEDLAEVTANGARLLTPPQERLLRIRP